MLITKKTDVEDKRLAPVQRELGLTELARRVGDDFTTLARNHIELARIELSAGLRKAAVNAVAVLLGGGVALIGLLLLCLTAVVAAEPIVPALWLRLLIGAVLYMAIGTVVSAVFVRRLRGGEVALKTAIDEVSRTAQAIKEQVQNG